MRACTVVAHSMELDELLFSSFFMDHGNKLTSSKVPVLDFRKGKKNPSLSLMAHILIIFSTLPIKTA